MKNPISCISNIAFPLSTLALIVMHDMAGAMPVYLLTCANLLCIGSWGFHATTRGSAMRRSETPIEYRWRKMDEIGMYAFFNALFGMFLWGLAGFSHEWFIIIATLSVTIGMGIFHTGFESAPELGQFFIQLFIISVVAGGYLNGRYDHAIYALIVAALAYGLRNIGERAAVSNRRYADALHAGWHVLMAASFMLMQKIIFMAG